MKTKSAYATGENNSITKLSSRETVAAEWPFANEGGRLEQRTTRQAKAVASTLRIEDAPFHPHAEELTRTWHQGASSIISINAYPNGIAMSQHVLENDVAVAESAEHEQAPAVEAEPVSPYHPSQFHLRFRDTRDYLLPSGRYFVYREGYAVGLERRLAQLREQGRLESTVIYFGTASDPFLPFQSKFDVTMCCLNLFERYRPGFLVIQTRSPMVIAALPTLKCLQRQSAVVISIESRLEQVIARYTPGQPKISERLVAADGLRRQGIPVNLNVSPILPYGEVQRDAWDFAALLDAHGDFITLGCLASGGPEDELRLKNLPISRRLVGDKQYRWLRPHCYRNLYLALKMLAPEKLLLPKRAGVKPSQLNLFAA